MSAEKQACRKQMLQIRNSLAPEERAKKDQLICEALGHSDVYKAADVILSYASYNSETGTSLIHSMIHEDHKRLALPKVVSKTEMIFYEVTTPDDLMAGYMGIPEPDSARCRVYIPEDHALMLMPGLAFDDMRYRMGYGGGFYDRYLSQYKAHLTCAMIAYEEQKISCVPHDDHDKQPDLIITDKTIYR